MSLILLNQMAASGSNPNAWNISKAYYDVKGSGNPWTVIDIPPSEKITAPNLGGSPKGAFFKSDGTKMYILDSGIDDKINEYNLTIPWDTTSSLTYIKNVSVTAQTTAPTDLFFKPDGTKMYITSTSGTNSVLEYDLSTSWNISTTSYARSYAVDPFQPEGLFFKPDGTKMYISGPATAQPAIKEYDLSSPWNVSTASITSNLSTGVSGIHTGLSFKPDGTKMFFVRYITPSAGDYIEEFNLATPWSVSTASRVGTGFLLTDVNPESLYFKTDGSTFYIAINNNVRQYLVGGKDFDVLAGQGQLNGLHFKADGTKLYIVGSTPDAVNELSLSIPWDVTTASNVRSYAVTQSTIPEDLFFKPDGTKMYVIGEIDAVFEYDLSVAWDISTTSFVRSKSVGTGAGGETSPTGLFFKPDGTVMYVTGTVTDRVIQYNLTSSWNIATASATGNGFFDLVTNTGAITGPEGLFFKSDGTKMYVAASAGSTQGLEEFTLSTPWNVTTATWSKSLPVELGSAQDPTGIFFKPDGTQFWISYSGTGTENRIFSYKISPT